MQQMSQGNVKLSLRNLALQHGITDDLTQDWQSLLSLAVTAPLFIFRGDENEGKKFNRIYFYFKLTLCYIKAKLDLFEKDTAESQLSLERLSAPYRRASGDH